MLGSNSFEVPALARAQQSAAVYYEKLLNGRGLVVRGWAALLKRFVFARLWGRA
jgi:hypothetical protein